MRLLLLEESYGRTDLALPDAFTVKHEDYTLDVGRSGSAPSYHV